MHTYLFFLFCFFLWCVSILSPSLSRIDCAWHLSANLLWLGTLLVWGLLPLILPFPLFMFGSVMGRPNRTSLRTFRNMVFLWSTMLFCRTFLTLLSLLSFKLGVGNLLVRDPYGVLSCLYRSSTPIYTISMPLYLSLPWHSEVHIPQLPRILYSRYYISRLYRILITSIVSVLELCPKMSFCLISVRNLLCGMRAKTPHTRALQKVRDSLIWWWHLFILHCLTITPSQSLMLSSFCPS